MLECPKCGEELSASFTIGQDEDANYVEVELSCKNEHQYFVRIKEDDLIEC